MKISPQFNKYANALIKEFSKCDYEVMVNINNGVFRFVPSKNDFKTVRELFKIISLFPNKDGSITSFKDIEPKELLECIERFKYWSSLNGFEFQDDIEAWNKIFEMYS